MQSLKRKSFHWSLEEACSPAKKARLELLWDEELSHPCPVCRQAGCFLMRQCPSGWKPEDAPVPVTQASIIQDSEARNKEDDVPTSVEQARIGRSTSQYPQEEKWPGDNGELAKDESGTSNRSKTEAGQGPAEYREDCSDTLAQSENEMEEEEESLTVKVPSTEDILHLGQMVRWMHLSVLVNNVKFSFPRLLLLQVLRSIGSLSLEHMPRHLPHRHDSHRGFAVVTYRTAYHTDAALREGRTLLEEAGCHGVLLRRLGNYPGYAKYCEGIDVGQVMKELPSVEEAAVERHSTSLTASPSRPRRKQVGKKKVARSVLESGVYKARRMVKKRKLCS